MYLQLLSIDSVHHKSNILVCLSSDAVGGGTVGTNPHLDKESRSSASQRSLWLCITLPCSSGMQLYDKWQPFQNNSVCGRV